MRITASSGILRARPAGSSAAGRPTSQCVSKKVAVSDAMTMSPSATKWRPPPEHMPFTAVITGFQQRHWSAVIWL